MVDKVGLIEQQLGDIRCLQTSFTKTTQMPCLLHSFSRIRAFEYTIYDCAYLKKNIYNLFSLSTQITTRGYLAKSSHLMTLPSFSGFGSKRKRVCSTLPGKSDNFAIDVWRMICESNHLSSFVYICQCGLRWQERSLGSSEWVFWCIYRPKHASKDVKSKGWTNLENRKTSSPNRRRLPRQRLAAGQDSTSIT